MGVLTSCIFTELRLSFLDKMVIPSFLNTHYDSSAATRVPLQPRVLWRAAYGYTWGLLSGQKFFFFLGVEVGVHFFF